MRRGALTEVATLAEMAHPVAMLEERWPRGGVLNAEGQDTYRLTEHGVRSGHTLAMVEGEGREKVLEALLAEP